ncbi:MAG: RNase adapter RapZ [Coriobacteriia bacterium]|nr:RNase adapter RapZ [Coriobacteriia bacterium]
MSGAGRTEAMHTFEDLEYFCIDNLPPSLLLNLVSLAGLSAGGKRKLAVVCDLRAKEFFHELKEELRRIAEAGISYRILFLDSRDDVLLARFKASRRRHPLTDAGMTIIGGIQRERELLATVREMAHSVIDTSDIEPRDLRKQIRDLFTKETEQESLTVSVFSFGFKHGMPIDADIIIDVRFLPNPYYELALRPLTGLDDQVRAFVLDREETRRFSESWRNLLDVVMPGYVTEGKQVLSIGIGCTGGQHRSVALAEETGRHLRQTGYKTTITHRDLALAEVN